MKKTTNHTRTTKTVFSEQLLLLLLLVLQPRYCLSRLFLLLVVALALLSLSSKCFVASFTTTTTTTTTTAAVPLAPIPPNSGVVVRSLSRDGNQFDYGYNDNYEKEGGPDDNVVAETTQQQHHQQQQQQHSYQYQYEQQQLRRRSRRSSAWILLVDDEEPIRRAVGQFFLDKGFGTVTTCADGRAALEVVAAATAARQRQSQQQERDGNKKTTNYNNITNITNNENDKNNKNNNNVPDCIVSDIRMPGMDGLELLNHIRQSSHSDSDSDSDSDSNLLAQQLARVPVVLVSARAMLRDRIAGYNAGADAYLTKPFSADELLAIVETCLERSEHLEEERARIALDSKPVTPEDLSSEIARIRSLLVHNGNSKGNGLGVVGRNGWVRKTDVFLSKDERDVLELLSRGLITKEIAAKTHLSKRRIEQLLTGMFRKAGVKNRTELVRWAVETGNVE